MASPAEAAATLRRRLLRLIVVMRQSFLAAGVRNANAALRPCDGPMLLPGMPLGGSTWGRQGPG
jgi:hypothetical protein